MRNGSIKKKLWTRPQTEKLCFSARLTYFRGGQVGNSVKVALRGSNGVAHFVVSAHKPASRSGVPTHEGARAPKFPRSLIRGAARKPISSGARADGTL